MFAGSIPSRGRIELVPAPEPTLTDEQGVVVPNAIIFQPELACLCGSDLPYFDSDNEHGPYPHRLGHSLHEMIGTVVATSGQRFTVGQKVLAVPLNQVGFFERYRLSEDRAIPLDPRKPPEQALLAQPLGTVIYALKKLPTLLDQDVAIVGQGPIGQMFNACARNLGARRIIGIDKLRSRLAVSQQMGATDVVCAGETDAPATVAQLLDGRLPDVVIECVGHRDQQLNLCIDLCRHLGKLLYFGVPPATLDGVRWRDLFYKNVTVFTSVNPDFARDFPLAMQWISEGRIDLAPLVTHRFPLAQVQQAFELFRDRGDGCQKVLLDFSR